MIQFTVYGQPAPAGSKRAFVVKGRAVVTDANTKARPWKAQVAGAAAQAMEIQGPVFQGRLLDGPLSLHVRFTLPRPKGHLGSGRNTGKVKASAPPYPAVKPDATKLLRAVEDACTGVVWRDDAQIVKQYVEKVYGEPARAEISVRELLAADQQELSAA